MIPALLGLFISSDASICSAMVFPPLGNSDHVVVSVSIDFPSYSQRDFPFHGMISLNVVLLLLLVNFAGGFSWN